MLLILIFFSLDPQGSKSDGTHKKGTSFLFIQDYTSLLIHAMSGRYLIWETAKWYDEFKISVCFVNV